MKYIVEFDWQKLAEVDIVKSIKSHEAIKEMVEFWGMWEDRLEDADGNYLNLWMKQLGEFILLNRRLPDKEDEGWYVLDGTYDITLISYDLYEHSSRDFEVKCQG